MLFDKRQVTGVVWASRIVSHSMERLMLLSALLLELELVKRLAPDRQRPLLLPVLLFELFSRLRPEHLAKKYWHVMPRHSHFEHDGFSLGHLTLDKAQA